MVLKPNPLDCIVYPYYQHLTDRHNLCNQRHFDNCAM